jgi:hypothetical protein
MKTIQILKAILIGIASGAAIFFIPFPFRLFFGFLFIFFIIRFFIRGRWRNDYRKNNSREYNFWNPSYTQRWQSMSDEERKAFIKKMEGELFKSNPVTE